MGDMMEPVTIAAMGVLSGGFLFGMWYVLVRSDAKLNMRPGMSAEGLRQDTGAPSFGRTKQEIDRKLAIVEARRRRAELIESRLAGWWAYKLKSDCVRIWLNVSEQERARRVTIREGTTRDDAISANKARLLVDNERYQKMYGLTPDDPTPYTHIIDAADITAEEVLGEAIKILGVE